MVLRGPLPAATWPIPKGVSSGTWEEGLASAIHQYWTFHPSVSGFPPCRSEEQEPDGEQRENFTGAPPPPPQRV